MAKGPAEAANLIDTVLEVDHPPTKARDILLRIIIAQGWFSGSQAEDQADAWEKRFISRLEFIFEQCKTRGSFSHFAFNSSGSQYIQGYCFCEPNDDSNIVEAKKRRSQTLRISQAVRALSPAEFESLSGKILYLLKVEHPYVSRRSADQGVDFFGRVPLGDLIKPKILDSGAEKNLSVWIVGQSKHYPETRVSTSEIRELVGSVEFARAKIFAGNNDPLSDLKARLCDPIIYMFFTSGRFTRDSHDLLDRSGVLSFEGLQIAQFLADHAVATSSGNFEAVEFRAWLAS